MESMCTRYAPNKYKKVRKVDKYKREKILEGYIKLCDKLNKTASRKDIEKASMRGEICSVGTIYKYFSSLVELQKESGYELNVRKRPVMYTREFLLGKLEDIYNNHGGKVNKEVLSKEYELVSFSHYYKIIGVGSFEEMWDQVENYMKDIK